MIFQFAFSKAENTAKGPGLKSDKNFLENYHYFWSLCDSIRT